MSEPVKLSKNPFDNFLAGARQGFSVWWKFVAPAILMAYVITKFLQVTGILDLFSKYGGPVMMIFGGLPGVAMVAFISGFFSKGGGTAAAAAMYLEGSMTGADCAVLLVLIMSCGGLLGQWLRIVCVSGTSAKRQPWMFAVAFSVGLISAWILRALLLFA